MSNQINELTSSLEQFVKNKEQQQQEEIVNEESGVNQSLKQLATKAEIQEILQKLEELQMSIDRMMDVRNTPVNE